MTLKEVRVSLTNDIAPACVLALRRFNDVPRLNPQLVAIPIFTGQYLCKLHARIRPQPNNLATASSLMVTPNLGLLTLTLPCFLQSQFFIVSASAYRQRVSERFPESAKADSNE